VESPYTTACFSLSLVSTLLYGALPRLTAPSTSNYQPKYYEKNINKEKFCYWNIIILLVYYRKLLETLGLLIYSGVGVKKRY
jgi:hypothetical protein